MAKKHETVPRLKNKLINKAKYLIIPRLKNKLINKAKYLIKSSTNLRYYFNKPWIISHVLVTILYLRFTEVILKICWTLY